MPKNLYLLRHAHSLHKQLGQPDKTRELSQKGISECFQIGAHLLHQRAKIDMVFSSSATRAMETTKLLADTIKLDQERILFEDELYDASVRTFLGFINRMDDNLNAVMCVGHNPAITYLSEYLTREAIGEMATGSIAIIRFDFSSWNQAARANGKLLKYIIPSSKVLD